MKTALLIIAVIILAVIGFTLKKNAIEEKQATKAPEAGEEMNADNQEE